MEKVKIVVCRKCGLPGVVTSTLESVTGKPRKYYVLCMCQEPEYFDTAEEALRRWVKTNAKMRQYRDGLREFLSLMTGVRMR